MRVAIIGSGMTGMTVGLLLARRGHDVVLADRDPGPVAGRPWTRVGVMQFHLPHAFRAQVRELLQARLPDVYQAVLDEGATVVVPAGFPEAAAMLHVRRSVFERCLWEHASAEPRVTRVTGHVDCVEVADGSAVGIVVDSGFVPADLVVDASGRAGRVSAAHRPAARHAECGMAYASRQYRLRPGAGPGPRNGGPGYVAELDGFVVMVFVHEAGTFTVLLVRRADDHELVDLRHAEAFEAACGVISDVGAWTDPARSEPIDVVRAGAGLANDYRGQSRSVAGLLAVGDSFCTTNPTGARGIPLGMQTAAYLADLVEQAPREQWADALDAWGRAHLEPWYDDHVAWDRTLLRRWAHLPVDADGPIGLDVLAAAAAERPELAAVLGPFYAMLTGPDSLAGVREQVRGMLRAGWTPPVPSGVTRDDLVAAVRTATSSAAA